ncbi:MAG: cation transporter [Fibrobacter sp.]|nr:cation transporter [Fibrobacter sp.]
MSQTTPQNLNLSDLNTPKSIGKQIRQVTWVGLFLNFILALLKFILGWLGNSKALLADSVHSLTDLSTDLIVIIGSHFWLKPPDDDHHYGHGKIESLVTITIGISLGLVAILMSLNAINALHKGQFIRPSWFVAVVALVSIVSKEILFRWTFKKSKILRSSALKANAWHHRSDAISSIPVLITILIAFIFPDWAFLDALGAIIVSLLIAKTSLEIIRPSFGEILDASAPPEVAEQIINIAENTRGVLNCHDLRTRYVAGCIQADLHIVLPSDMTIKEGHEISETVVKNILQHIPEISDILIHIDPFNPN